MMARRRELEKDWYAAVKPMSPSRGFSLFLDFVLEDFRKRPGLFHLVSLNFRQVDPDNPIPGFDLIEAFIKTEIDRMKANLGMEIPGHEAEAFMRVFNTLMIGFLGGRTPMPGCWEWNRRASYISTGSRRAFSSPSAPI
jgi:hypothetical protein